MDSSDTNDFDDLRGSGPYEVVCERCANRFGFAATHPFRDELLFGIKLVPKSERTGGYSDVDGYQIERGEPIGVSFGYHPDSREWKQQQRRRIVATGPERFTFNCEACGQNPTFKMPALILRYQSAHRSPPDHLMRV